MYNSCKFFQHGLTKVIFLWNELRDVSLWLYYTNAVEGQNLKSQFSILFRNCCFFVYQWNTFFKNNKK